MSYLDRPVIKVKFKSDPTLYADLYSELIWADSKAFRDNEEQDQNLFILIKEWNVPDLDLSYDNLGKLKRVDIEALFEAFNTIIDKEAAQTEKKKETKSSSPKQPTN